jgi:hypothetical protein
MWNFLEIKKPPGRVADEQKNYGSKSLICKPNAKANYRFPTKKPPFGSLS